MNRKKLVDYLDHYLRVAEIADYGPQGLQLESDNDRVERLALAVDVAPPIIDAVAAWGGDMLLVHHGLLWRDVQPLAGPLGRRVRALLAAGINLYAAHLPLDAHPEVGNNAELARRLGVPVAGWWAEVMGTPLGVIGDLPAARPLADFAAQARAAIGGEVRVLAHGPAQVRRVAILSGAGADLAGEARAQGADTYLTGETSHAHYWAAADHGLNVLFAGHYATETVGVQALGRHLEATFGLECRFFDFPTGM